LAAYKISESESIVTGVFQEDLVHVGGRVLEELVVRVEDDDGDLAVAQHAQLVRLLHQPELPLGEGDLPVALVRDAGDLNLLPAHLDRLVWSSRT